MVLYVNRGIPQRKYPTDENQSEAYGSMESNLLCPSK